MGLSITDAVKHILIINVVMFIGTLAISNDAFYTWFALYFPKNDLFQPWQVLTHMFMHGSPAHILFNMIGVWMFGSAVEQVFGWKKFLIFYLLCGFGAATVQIASLYFDYNIGLSSLIESGFSQAEIEGILMEGKYNTGWVSILGDDFDGFVGAFNSTMVGASGALFGLLVAYGMLYPESKVMLIFLPIPIKAKYFIPGLIIVNIASEIYGNSMLSPSNIAYMAHLGGALTGFILMFFWKKNEKDKYRWN